MQQFSDGSWPPIAYFSTKLQSAQTRYSTFDRELLAVYFAIKHFRHFVKGREFHIPSDHGPLTSSLQAHHNQHSPRQARHLDFVAQFTTDIRHISDADNAPADALSRMDLNSVIPENLKGINFGDISTKPLTESFRRCLTTLTIPSSNLRKCHSTLPAPPSSVTSPRVPTHPLCRRVCAVWCLILYIQCHINIDIECSVSNTRRDLTRLPQ